MYYTGCKINSKGHAVSIGFVLSLLICSNTNAREIIRSCQIPNYNETITPEITWPKVTNKTVLDARYWISNSQIAQLNNANQLVWIDVRSSLEKIKLPLDGVITLPLHTIQDKVFLRDQPIILVGTGFDQPLLNQACIKLQQAGFKQVQALTGGAYALKNTTSEITAEQFWLGSTATPWEIITVGLNEADLQSLPEKPFKNFASLESDTQQTIKQLLEEQSTSKNSFISFVLVTADKTATLQLQKNLTNSVVFKNSVWLEGGLQNYKQYIQRQQSIRSNAGRALVHPCG